MTVVPQPSNRESSPGPLDDLEIDNNDLDDGYNKLEANRKQSSDEPDSGSSDDMAVDNDEVDEDCRYLACNCIRRVSLLNVDKPRLSQGDIDVSITGSVDSSNVTSAGPRTLETLRSRVPSLLLSRFTRFDQTMFKVQASRLQCMPMCLLIGRYEDLYPARWGEGVWAYTLTKAEPNKRYAPTV